MKVLFICTANVCRSPLAEGYLKHLLLQHPLPDVEVESAGVIALRGFSAYECAIEVANQNGFDLNGHKARQITAEMAKAADQILCMETWQASRVLDLNQELILKTGLLGNYHPSGKRLMQIPDPRNFTVPDTLVVFEMIRHSVAGLYKNLSRF
ncbi:low molecular weight phosphotyrosine protein phosphatase [bacterium]|nr:low molecular weight phosphotyrosine protein phosphatase [bacterium]